ncbi:HAD superfamily hydrolase [Catenovulum agarivorans DS-2]|uniref:HAD superfamily hydrolase n=1 Tax=Catenovulum agarivorans DS-2 TaxID=1328313 RepID=W7QP05_9ALTE|nr:HAD family phosphatase [Catenovulum agarivorans]EWH10707.1 HAD superfamily hydrolase [Catenovulum agarivorans DS-2]
MSEFKAILFDKDGTIFDSEAVYRESWVKAANELGFHFTAEMYDPFVGVRAIESYQGAEKLFGPDFPIDEFIQRTRLYNEQVKKAGMPIKPGFEAFFSQAKKLNIPLGLVTSAVHDAAISTFQGTDFLQSFSVIVTGDMVEHPKPDPSCYQMACEQLKLKPSEVLVFEDSNAGVAAAVSAGCQTVAIPDYLPVKPELLKQAAYVFNSFNDALFLVK